MYKETIIFFLVWGSVVSSQAGTQKPLTWEEYKDKYHKNYTGSEEQMRKQFFQMRMKEIDPNAPYEEEINRMSDWSDSQIRGLSGLRLLNISDEQIQKTHTKSSKVGKPLKLDWRQKGIITSIKDQGKCGACWAFAAAAYSQSKLIKQGKQNIDIDLSEQYLLSCTRRSECDGGYLEYTFERIAEHGGLPTQDKYPYSPYGLNDPFICLTGDKVYVGYDQQKIYKATDEELQNLLQEGPLAIAISSNGWINYKSGIFRCTKDSKVDHAVLLVGYSPEYWIVKNQWGKDWGEDGYIRITKSRIDDANCFIGTSALYLYDRSLMIWALTALIIFYMVF